MRNAWAGLLCCLLAGCLQPIRTDSRVSIAGPVHARVTAELEPKNNASPLEEMPIQGHAGQGPKIAVLDVDGLLLNHNLTGPYSAGDNPVDLFKERLNAAAADPNVCGLVVRINSPGGAVTATDIMWQELQAFRARSRKPVVACLMDLGTSGGYYLATASNAIVAHPTTVTGGIGVVFNLFNLRDALAIFRISNQSIKAGNNIDMGNITAPLSPETKKHLQSMADEFHLRFQTIVKQQRPDVNPNDETTFDGRVFTARQALARKLIDRIGYLDDAANLARHLAGQPDARLVMYHRPNDPARTPYATTPNVPLQSTLFPLSIPSLDRSRLPTFLYLWQPDPTLVKMGGQ